MRWIYPESKLIATELGFEVSHLNNFFQNIYDLDVVRGKKKSTNLANRLCDKIFLRQVFHHFKHPNEMFKSISQTLKLDGEVIVIENSYDLNGTTLCRKAMGVSKIKDIWIRNGFGLINEIIVGKQHLLKFKYIGF